MLKLFFLISSLFCFGIIFSQETDTSFTFCEEVRVWPYYYPGLKYEGGFWQVKHHFRNNYPVEKFKALDNNSGIITIQFKVNCKGETGMFYLQQCDLAYKPTVMHNSITDYFLDKTKLLHNWIVPKDEEGNKVNCHKFFSFKIKSGQLIEILPK